MAEKVVEEVRVLRRGGGVAIVCAVVALVVAVCALILSLRALNHADAALKAARDSTNKTAQLNKRLDDALGKNALPATGPGTGPNTPVPAGNPLPNGNGQ